MSTDTQARALATPRLRAATAPARRTGWSGALLTFAQKRSLGAAGGVVIVLMLLAAIFASAIAPYDPLDTSFLDQLKPPSAEHLVGTDAF